MNKEATQPTEEVLETSTPEEEDLSPSSSNDWDNFVQEFDTDEGDVEDSEPTPPAAEKPEPQPSEDDGGEEAVQEAETEPTSEVETPAPAVEETAEEPAPPPETEPEVQATTQVTPEQRAELRSQALQSLATRYALSEDDAREFEMNPEKALPKLAANLHLQVYEQVVSTVMQQIPGVVNTLTTQRVTAEQKENEFYSEYEDLRPYKDQVLQVAQMWTQMNPKTKLTPKQRSAEIAKFARAALGLTPQTTAIPRSEGSNLPPASPPPAPQARPVTPQGRTADMDNPWVQMAIELENDPD